MKYMFLLYDKPEIDPKLEEEEMPLWFEYTKKLQDAGVLIGGEALEGISTATTIRGKAAKGYEMFDGPFAETKEVLSGYYIIDVDNLDEAAKWASQVPHVAHGGTVEIRPVFEMPDE